MYLWLLEERSSPVKKPTGVRVRQGAEEMSHFLEGSFEGKLVLLQHLRSAKDRPPGLQMI